MPMNIDTTLLKKRIEQLVERQPRFFMLLAGFLEKPSTWGFIQITRSGKQGDELTWAEHYTHR